MKKYITLGLLVAGLAFGMNISADAAVNKTMKADVQAIRIPAGSTMKLELIEPLSTRTGSVGDQFSAMLKADKIVNGQIALPAGSIIRGTINKIDPSK